MRTLLAVCLALSVATGCSKGDPEQACKHMLDLAHADLQKSLAELEKSGNGDMLKGLKEQAEAKRDSDLATCVSKVKEHDIDTGCILKANNLDDAQRCLIKR
jgi:hypothetical protein